MSIKFKTWCLGLVAIASFVLPGASVYCRQQVAGSRYIDLDAIPIDSISYHEIDLLKVISDLAGKAGVEVWVGDGVKSAPVTIELKVTTVSRALKTVLSSCSPNYVFDLVTLGKQCNERNVLVVGVNNCDPHAWIDKR